MPVTFAVQGDIIVIAIDHKPKRSMNLKRLRNIADNPRVSLLVDSYDDDWSQLWWVRADGVAAVLEEDTERAALWGHFQKATYVAITIKIAVPAKLSIPIMAVRSRYHGLTISRVMRPFAKGSICFEIK